MKEIIPVVDINDNIIEYKNRDDVLADDIYRIVVLLVENSKGEILLCKRSADKKKHPNMWQLSVAGTVSKGESYDECIKREMFEELGLKDVKPKLFTKFFNTGDFQHFTSVYTLELDKPLSYFKPNNESSEIKWWNKETLKKELKENPKNFVEALTKYIRIFL